MLHKTHSRSDEYENESRRHSNTGSRSFITHTHSHSHSLAENQFQFNCKIPGNYVVNVLFLVVRFGSKYSQRYIFFGFNAFPLKLNTKRSQKKHRHNASFRVWRPRERDATSTTGLERLTGRADWAKLSCVGPSRCAALRRVALPVR